MIDGVIGVCPTCGLTVTVVPGIQLIHRAGPMTLVDWKCECGHMARLAFGRDWFKKRLTPAIRWWAKQEGERPWTDQELVLREFVLDLEAVDGIVDLELYWKAQKSSSIPKEAQVANGG